MVQVLISEIVLSKPGMFRLPTPGSIQLRLQFGCRLTVVSPAIAPTKSPRGWKLTRP